MPWRPAELQHGVGRDLLPLRRTVIAQSGWFPPTPPSREAERHGEVAQMVLERLDDLLVANSSMRSRFSTTVTLVPEAANMDAYSMPITPRADDHHRAGHLSRLMIPSESMIVLSSNATLDGRAGLVAVAMTILSAVTLRVRPPGRRPRWSAARRNTPCPAGS